MGRESANVQMHEETFDDSIKEKKAKKNLGREAPSVQMHGETFDHTIKDKKANKKSKTCDHHQRSKDLSCESGSNSHSEGQTDVIVSKGEHGKNNTKKQNTNNM